MNAVKTGLAACINALSVLVFVWDGLVVWRLAAIMALAAIVGGYLGAHYGRRLPELWLRRIVIVGGTIVAIILIVD